MIREKSELLNICQTSLTERREETLNIDSEISAIVQKANSSLLRKKIELKPDKMVVNKQDQNHKSRIFADEDDATEKRIKLSI